MYSGSGYSVWEIGDVDVIIHEGVYHLFHLIIPNHDYIAHAISQDGITWRRAKNAIFVGDPGEWDDDMLWTMHVSRLGDLFIMYYTGLRRKDRGVIQKIGCAVSKNLLHWKKIQGEDLPIEPTGPHYENLANNPRKWLSFRDPFRFIHQNQEYLLICARCSNGPISRRGCVGLAKITNGKITLEKPMLSPLVYDDIECPALTKIKEKFYLIGSIREDIKVRYWFSEEFRGEYHSFHSDVLLPQGNYAARPIKDGENTLIYNFYYTDGEGDSLRALPPPKQLDVDDKGRLLLKSYYRWEMMVDQTYEQREMKKVLLLLSNETSHHELTNHKWTMSTKSGYEVFVFEKAAANFIWEGVLTVEGWGKFGLITDMDSEANGYFISFDAINGLVQIREWGFEPTNHQKDFIFHNLQSNVFKLKQPNSFHFKLIRYGNYIELSMDGVVKLTLIDYTYSDKYIGLYSASSVISLSDSVLKTLPEPEPEYGSQELES